MTRPPRRHRHRRRIRRRRRRQSRRRNLPRPGYRPRRRTRPRLRGRRRRRPRPTPRPRPTTRRRLRPLRLTPRQRRRHPGRLLPGRPPSVNRREHHHPTRKAPVRPAVRASKLAKGRRAPGSSGAGSPLSPRPPTRVRVRLSRGYQGRYRSRDVSARGSAPGRRVAACGSAGDRRRRLDSTHCPVEVEGEESQRASTLQFELDRQPGDPSCPRGDPLGVRLRRRPIR